jgi:hypothetical protein
MAAINSTIMNNQISLTSGLFMIFCSIPNGMLRTVIATNHLSFKFHVIAFSIEKAPQLADIVLRCSSFTLIQLGLINRQTIDDVIARFKQHNTGLYDFLEFAPKGLASAFKDLANGVNICITSPLTSCLLETGSLTGNLWCSGVDCAASLIFRRQNPMFRISGKLIVNTIKAPGYILQKTCALAAPFLVHPRAANWTFRKCVQAAREPDVGFRILTSACACIVYFGICFLFNELF